MQEQRERAGYSRAKLGQLLGISPGTIEGWELGRVERPPVHDVIRLARFLQISHDDLLAAVTADSGGFVLTEESRDALIRRLEAIAHAGEDMLDVLAAAEHLLALPPVDGDRKEDDEARMRRTLETGMVITYARPFKKSRGLQQLKRPAGLSAEQRTLHQQMLDFRDVVYAHTDDTPMREIVEMRDRETLESWLRDPSNWQVSRYFPTEKLLAELAGLARANLAAFLAEFDEIAERLARAGRLEHRSGKIRIVRSPP